MQKPEYIILLSKYRSYPVLHTGFQLGSTVIKGVRETKFLGLYNFNKFFSPNEMNHVSRVLSKYVRSFTQLVIV